MKIKDILDCKGHEVVTTTGDQTVLSAMRILVAHNIGSVVVMEGEEIRGIFTERDALRLGAEGPGKLAETPVREAMTQELVIGLGADSVQYTMDVMTRNRIRHIPVMHGDRLEGIVSLGDLVNACRQEVEVENRYLRDYIQGTVY